MKVRKKSAVTVKLFVVKALFALSAQIRAISSVKASFTSEIPIFCSHSSLLIYF